MRIFGQNIPKGKRTTIKRVVATLHTGTQLEISVVIDRAKKDGPTLLLSSGIHGNEVNGVEIVRQLIAKGFTKPERGMVISIPVVNVLGFLNKTREFPDGRDLNRMFPGSPKGSLASRYAHALMTNIIPFVDYGIDYHTGGASRFNYAQIRINADDPENVALAKAFGAKFIIDANMRDKSFREAASKQGKKMLLFEGGKAMNLDKVVTKVGVAGAKRVMQHLELRNFEEELNGGQPEPPIFVHSSSWIRAAYSGMFRTYVKNGKSVKKGELMGTITDPFGKIERNVKAPHSGYIFCLNHAPLVTQGDALVHLTSRVTMQD
jgi:predicted deacylase